jgi:hypothetical protein
MKIAVICSELGWTLKEYEDNPKWFLDLICKKMEIDAWRLKQKMPRK